MSGAAFGAFLAFLAIGFVIASCTIIRTLTKIQNFTRPKGVFRYKDKVKVTDDFYGTFNGTITDRSPDCRRFYVTTWGLKKNGFYDSDKLELR